MFNVLKSVEVMVDDQGSGYGLGSGLGMGSPRPMTKTINQTGCHDQ